MGSSATAHLSPGSAAGIVFQVHRVLTHLVREPGATRVGFELFDDVAVEDINGRRLVEQDKLEPLTDESDSLWKTLRNWLNTYRGMNALERVETRYCVVTRAQTPSRSPLVSKLATASKDQALIDECVALLSSTRAERRKRRQADAARKTPGKPPKREDVDDYMDFVLLAPPDERKAIVSKMAIVFGADPVSVTSRDALTRALLLTRHENSERVLNTVLGWVTTSLLQFVGQRKDCWIEREAFTQQLLEARLASSIPPARLRGQREIRDAERAKAATTERVYRDRLVAVGFGDEFLGIATERYLNHRAELIHLSLTGAIVSAGDEHFRSDRENYYDQLHDTWTTAYLRVRSSPAGPDLAGTGRRLFSDVLDHARAAGLLIGRLEVSQEYFIEGGFHALANKEHPDGEVWWLPDQPHRQPTSIRTNP